MPFPGRTARRSDVFSSGAVSGTGRFKGLRGAGTLHIKSAGPTDRLFILDGTLAAVGH